MKYVIGLIVVVLTSALVWVLRDGVRPRALRILNPTRFEAYEEIGASLYRRLRIELRSGSGPDFASPPWVLDAPQIWEGMILAARAEGVEIVEVQQSEWVRPLRAFANVPVRSLDSQPTYSEMANALSPRWRIRHGLPSDFKRGLQIEPQRPLFVVTLWSVIDGDIENIQPPCHEEEVNFAVLTELNLGCHARRVSKLFRQKQLDSRALWAVVEGYGRSQYLILVSRSRL